MGEATGKAAQLLGGPHRGGGGQRPHMAAKGVLCGRGDGEVKMMHDVRKRCRQGR